MLCGVVACCRDDLIFLIYLYQRWIYRVDMTRVNEFGFTGKQQEERDAAAAAAALAAGEGAEPALALEVSWQECAGVAATVASCSLFCIYPTKTQSRCVEQAAYGVAAALPADMCCAASVPGCC